MGSWPAFRCGSRQYLLCDHDNGMLMCCFHTAAKIGSGLTHCRNPRNEFACMAIYIYAWKSQEPESLYGHIYSEVRGCSTGKSFCFVRACERAVWLPNGIGAKCLLAGLFPFPFLAHRASPFPFWGDELSLFPYPTPQTSYPILVGLIGIYICIYI